MITRPFKHVAPCQTCFFTAWAAIFRLTVPVSPWLAQLASRLCVVRKAQKVDGTAGGFRRYAYTFLTNTTTNHIKSLITNQHMDNYWPNHTYITKHTPAWKSVPPQMSLRIKRSYCRCRPCAGVLTSLCVCVFSTGVQEDSKFQRGARCLLEAETKSVDLPRHPPAKAFSATLRASRSAPALARHVFISFHF